MQPIVVSDRVAVGEFPTLDQIELLASAGFAALLNCQPDGEVERFPWSGEVAAKARALGLKYAYAPLASRTPPAEQLAALVSAVADLPAPVYAFCYSGARAAAACALMAAVPGADPDRIVGDFAKAGFDVGALTPWLAERCGVTARPAKAEPAPSKAEAPAAASAPQAAAPAKTAPAPATIAVAPPAPPAVNGTKAAPVEPKPTGELPKPPAPLQGIVIQPRAAGFGGFAV